MFEINVSADKGYAWAFPSKGNLLNIGIGVPVSIFKKDKLDINKLLDNFVLELEGRGVVVENIRKQKSYLLPFASSRPKRKKDFNIARQSIKLMEKRNWNEAQKTAKKAKNKSIYDLSLIHI